MILSLGCAVACFAKVRLRPAAFAVLVFVQTWFKQKLVGRPGLEPADGSDLWFKAHPKEEPMNHSLATVQRGARRAPATRDHRIKSPLGIQCWQGFSAPP